MLYSLEPVLGALLLLLIWLDIFLTVLYARIGAGLIGNRLARLTWRIFVGLSASCGKHRGKFLSFCGPIILIVVLTSWALALVVGGALIIHPYLATSVRATGGPTQRDFVTALYAGGSSISVGGASSFWPGTSPFRLFFLLNSFVGISALSLTVTYLMQVYSALQSRNTLGLKVYLMTARTGDAAVLVGALGPQGQFTSCYSILAELAAEVSEVKEMHHFYPVLFYFRFAESFYSTSMYALLCLDTVTLLRTAIHDDFAWLKESVSVGHLWHATILLLTTLEKTFLPTGPPDVPVQPDAETEERWKGRYRSALRQLQRAGVKTIEDEAAGASAYVALRMQWDAYITRLAPRMGYELADIDPASCKPLTSAG